MWKQRWLGKNKEICGLIEYGSNECDSLVVTFPGLGQAMSEKNYLFSNLRKHLEKEGKSSFNLTIRDVEIAKDQWKRLIFRQCTRIVLE